MSTSWRWLLLLVGLWLMASGCKEDGSLHARQVVREQHSTEVANILLKDLQTHRVGLRKAAAILAPGFVRATGVEQEVGMRKAMKIIRGAKKGVSELVISSMSFLAVVDKNGVVIARDLEPDEMKGMNLAKLFPSVAHALAGNEDFEVGEFANPKDKKNPSVSIVMATPARYQGEVVGAVVLGIPLWRMAQRMSRQLQMEYLGDNGPAVLWVYLYRGDKLHHHGTSPDLDKVVPNGDARRAGLAKSPGGFTGGVQQHSAWYGYGVRPLRVLGSDTGAVIFRMDPKK